MIKIGVNIVPIPNSKYFIIANIKTLVYMIH